VLKTKDLNAQSLTITSKAGFFYINKLWSAVKEFYRAKLILLAIKNPI